MCNRTKDADPTMIREPEPEKVVLSDEQRAHYLALFEHPDCQPRIKAIAERFFNKKQARRRVGDSIDASEELLEFIHEGLERVHARTLISASAPRPSSWSNSRRSSTTETGPSAAASATAKKKSLREPILTEDEKVLPWRPPPGRPDVAAERRSTQNALRARIARDAPLLSELLELYLAEIWGKAEQAKMLGLPENVLGAMRAELRGHLLQFAEESR